MDDRIAGEAAKLASQAQDLATQLKGVAQQITDAAAQGAMAPPDGHMPFVALLTIFAMACFVGYYVVWNVTPALHTPLMSVTNAISSIICIGALVQVAPPLGENAAEAMNRPAGWILGLALVAIALTCINMFGGFAVTQRMLQMFRK